MADHAPSHSPGSGPVLRHVGLGLENVLTLVTVELGLRSLRVDPCTVLLHPLLAEEVQLALVTLVQRAQAGFHHPALKVDPRLVRLCVDLVDN